MVRFSLKMMAVVCLGALGVQAQTMHPVAPGTRSGPARTTGATASPGTAAKPAPATASGDVPESQRQASVPSPATPAVAPVVTYHDGLLGVQATNATLSSVVTAIRNKTGIEFEGMDNNSERVVLSLGPAPAGEVLSAIFSGAKYDFVAIERPDSPGIVQRVMVTVKSKAGATPDAPQQPHPANADDEDTPDEQVNSGGDPQDTPVQPPPVQQPQQVPQAQQQPKSPEQLLQELQQMQQQKAAPDPNNPSTAPRKQPQM
jgi:hypothetical protein